MKGKMPFISCAYAHLLPNVAKFMPGHISSTEIQVSLNL